MPPPKGVEFPVFTPFEGVLDICVSFVIDFVGVAILFLIIYNHATPGSTFNRVRQ